MYSKECCRCCLYQRERGGVITGRRKTGVLKRAFEISEEELSSLFFIVVAWSVRSAFVDLCDLIFSTSHAIDHLRHGQCAAFLDLDNTPNWIAKMSAPCRHHAPLGRV